MPTIMPWGKRVTAQAPSPSSEQTPLPFQVSPTRPRKGAGQSARAGRKRSQRPETAALLCFDVGGFSQSSYFFFPVVCCHCCVGFFRFGGALGPGLLP